MRYHICMCDFLTEFIILKEKKNKMGCTMQRLLDCYHLYHDIDHVANDLCHSKG